MTVQTRAAIRDALSGRDTALLNGVLGHGRVRLSVSAGLAPLRTLDADDPAWQPAVTAAANLLELLEQAPDRIKHCDNPACLLWFFDTTRNGTRRWCSMTVCGNRMKARRHYDRVKALLQAIGQCAAMAWTDKNAESWHCRFMICAYRCQGRGCGRSG